jgi:hypothetical protein
MDRFRKNRITRNITKLKSENLHYSKEGRQQASPTDMLALRTGNAVIQVRIFKTKEIVYRDSKLSNSKRVSEDENCEDAIGEGG